MESPHDDKDPIKVICHWIEHLRVVPDEDLEEEIHQTFATHKELATSLKNHLAATVFPRIEKQQRARGGKGSSHPSNRRTKANNPKESPKEEGEEETTEWQSAAARTSSNRTQQSHSPSPNGKKSTSKAAKLEAMSINEFMEYLKAHVIDNSKVYPLTPIKDLVIISNSNLEEAPLDRVQEIAKDQYKVIKTTNMLTLWNSIEMGRILLIAKNKVNNGQTEEVKFSDWLKNNKLCSYSHAQKLINLYTALRHYPQFKLCGVSLNEILKNLKRIQEFLADPINANTAKFWQQEIIFTTSPPTTSPSPCPSSSSSLVAASPSYSTPLKSNKRLKQDDE